MSKRAARLALERDLPASTYKSIGWLSRVNRIDTDTWLTLRSTESTRTARPSQGRCRPRSRTRRRRTRHAHRRRVARRGPSALVPRGRRSRRPTTAKRSRPSHTTRTTRTTRAATKARTLRRAPNTRVRGMPACSESTCCPRGRDAWSRTTALAICALSSNRLLCPRKQPRRRAAAGSAMGSASGGPEEKQRAVSRDVPRVRHDQLQRKPTRPRGSASARNRTHSVTPASDAQS
jgi:hypothetical protein